MSTIKLNTTGGSGGSVALKGPASTTGNADIELTLPQNDGNANQLLKTDGSGTLSWVDDTDTTNTNASNLASGTLPAARIADDSIVEAKLDVSNAPTNGQFLQAQSGEGGGLTWAAAGGGKLLQAVAASTSTEVEMTDTTWTDTGLTVTIDNVASGSSVLVLVDQQISARKDATGKSFGLRLLRGSTVIQAPLANSSGLPWENYIDIPNNGATRTGFSGRHSIMKLDASPGTGSVVYHVEMNNYASGSSSTLTAQRQDTTDSTSNITVLEIGA